MAYWYLEDITQADVAFEVRAETLEKLIAEAVDALLGVMVESPKSVDPCECFELKLADTSEASLVHAILEKIIFLKDIRLTLYRIKKSTFSFEEGSIRWVGELWGESLNPKKHQTSVDIKGVTHHRFSLKQIAQEDQDGNKLTSSEWSLTVVVDV